MITPEKILQIDATVLAGLLILLTLVSFQDTDNLYKKIDDLQKLEDEFKVEYQSAVIELMKYSSGITEIDEEIERIEQEMFEINKTKNLDREKYVELEKVLEQRKQEKVILNQNFTDFVKEDPEKFGEFLNKTIEGKILTKLIEEEEEKRKLEKQSFIAPEGWVWIVGYGFSISAIFAIIAIFIEMISTKDRFLYHLMIFVSLGVMSFGFFGLLAVFFAVMSY